MSEGNAIEIIVRGALFRGSAVLMCRNVKHGYLYLPGGHIEFGEGARAALEREILEECGLRVRAGALALVTEGAFDTRKRRHQEVNLVFHVEHDAGPPPERVNTREGAIDFQWLDIAAVTDLDVRPMAIKAWLMSPAASAVDFVSEFR